MDMFSSFSTISWLPQLLEEKNLHWWCLGLNITEAEGVCSTPEATNISSNENTFFF
jgi:hypothetical protein